MILTPTSAGEGARLTRLERLGLSAHAPGGTMSGTLAPHISAVNSHDVSSRSFGQLPRNSGFLEKLSSEGTLLSAKWQRRYFALGDGRLAWAKTAPEIKNCGDACLSL